jgi:hypothetical protein
MNRFVSKVVEGVVVNMAATAASLVVAGVVGKVIHPVMTRGRKKTVNSVDNVVDTTISEEANFNEEPTAVDET